MGASLQAENIYRKFTDDCGSEIVALDGFNIEVQSGEIVGIVGMSGCGKSTFLRLVAGLDEPQSGTLLLDGSNITGTNPRCGFIFQNATLFDWLTIEENIAFGLKARKKFKQNRAIVADMIKMVGLCGFEKSYPHQISGGMAARSSIARTFVLQPELVLLDEPLSALDAFTRISIQSELLKIQSDTNATYLLVTHDLEEAVFMCDRVVVMSERPGQNIGEIKIDIPRPRDRTSEEFNEYRREILEMFPLTAKKKLLA